MLPRSRAFVGLSKSRAITTTAENGEIGAIILRVVREGCEVQLRTSLVICYPSREPMISNWTIDNFILADISDARLPSSRCCWSSPSLVFVLHRDGESEAPQCRHFRCLFISSCKARGRGDRPSPNPSRSLLLRRLSLPERFQTGGNLQMSRR